MAIIVINLPGNKYSIDEISSWQLSTMKHLGVRLSFHCLTIDNASVMASVVSSCMANEATIW